MIGQIGLFLLGFITTGVINGFFGGISFYVTAIVLGLCAYYFMLWRTTALLSAFFLGYILSLETVSYTHPGFSLLLGAIILLITHFLPVALRFTTAPVQRIVGLLLVLLCYTIFIFGLSGTLHRLMLLLPVFLALSLWTLSTYSGNKDASYENP